jgi:TonB family protein
MPNPPYSDGARKLKLNGTVTAEAVINSEGKLESIRIVRGMPGGLNETTIAAMRTWRCHPALKMESRFQPSFHSQLLFDCISLRQP